MRLTWIAAGVALLVVGAVAGYEATVAYIPYAATDHLFAQFRKTGRTPNTLSAPNLRNARNNLVVRDNADTLTQSSMLDLAAGPVVFRAEVPKDAVYWSVSLFAHNTDTYFVANDRTLKPGPFSLLIRRKNQAARTATDAVAVSPSRWSFLIVRYTMRDRNDAALVTAMRAQMKASSVTPAG